MSGLRLSAIIIFLPLLFSQSSPSLAGQEFPLPSDVKIVAPGPEVPPEMASFSGTWKGKWKARAPFMYIVESIEPNGAVTLVYSWAKYRAWSWSGGYERNSGKISKGKLRFTNKHGEYTSRIHDDGRMLSEFRGPDFTSSGFLEKMY